MTDKYKSPEQQSFYSMRSRCLNKNNTRYGRYGGRGITIDPAWDSFDKFFEDMGPRPAGLTLDRINPDGNYCKENCRWVTPKENARNRTNHATLTVNGITRPYYEWCEITGLSMTTLCTRLKRGWSDERTVLQPLELHNRRKPSENQPVRDVQKGDAA